VAKRMLDKLGLSFAFLSLLTGNCLLYDAVSISDPTQIGMVTGLAVFFSLGLVSISLVARN